MQIRGEQIFESERFEDVDHVIGAWAFDDLDVLNRGSGRDVFGGPLRGAGWQGSAALRGVLRL